MAESLTIFHSTEYGPQLKDSEYEKLIKSSVVFHKSSVAGFRSEELAGIWNVTRLSKGEVEGSSIEVSSRHGS